MSLAAGLVVEHAVDGPCSIWQPAAPSLLAPPQAVGALAVACRA